MPAMDLLALYAQELAQRGFTRDPAQQAALARLDELRSGLIGAAQARPSRLRRWLDGPRSAYTEVRGLYLWGGVGRGKTWLMDLFFESLPFPRRQRKHFHRFMHDVHDQLRGLQQRAAPLEAVAARIARNARVLCFDELFVSDIADAMILGGLFSALFRRGVTLVATSNVPPTELYRDGLQRQRFQPTIELLEQHLDVFHMSGATDYRLRRLTQAGTYLASGAPDTPHRMQALFAALSDHSTTDTAALEHASAGRTIEIEGRAIPVLRENGSVVWFEFAALCSGPRSQEDYIEIARTYHTLMISGVPVFDAASDNEARRFIALVDETYDRNVNLIVSAAAAPADLYRGERFAASFQRSVSRLIEMQSEEYLAREHKP